MATTNDLKNGLVLNLDGQLWTVVEFQHVKPGKGGAFVRTKLKNVMSAGLLVMALAQLLGSFLKWLQPLS